MLDPVKNFAKASVSIGYDAAATSIILESGHGAKLPDPAADGAFNLVWWNFTDYTDPSDDPNVEIVRCTSRLSDTLAIARAQEGTAASNKNIADKTYKMILAPTSKMISDIGNQGMDVFDAAKATYSSSINKNTVEALAFNSASVTGEREVAASATATTDSQAQANKHVIAPNFSKNSKWRIFISSWPASVASDGSVGACCGVTGGGIGPNGQILSTNHYGFIKTFSGAQATSGSGSQTKSNITQGNDCMIIFTAGTSVKFYTDGVLRATHTTNIPSGAGTSPSHCIWAKSLASSSACSISAYSIAYQQNN